MKLSRTHGTQSPPGLRYGQTRRSAGGSAPSGCTPGGGSAKRRILGLRSCAYTAGASRLEGPRQRSSGGGPRSGRSSSMDHASSVTTKGLSLFSRRNFSIIRLPTWSVRSFCFSTPSRFGVGRALDMVSRYFSSWSSMRFSCSTSKGPASFCCDSCRKLATICLICVSVPLAAEGLSSGVLRSISICWCFLSMLWSRCRNFALASAE
mmetsp:Transcript_36698/g.86807  ORF Transcript_36698/g.86807 Transcript_36698/m.86807 type:complete len:207 (-) Transcript_36698:967-1587(-)